MIRPVAAVGAAFLISMIANTVYYAVTADGHRLPFTSEEPVFALLMLSHLIMATALFMALRWVAGHREVSWQTGASVGAFLGLIMFLPMGLIVRAAWDVPMTAYFAVDTALAIAVNAAMGVAIATVVRFDDAAAPA